MPKLSSTIAIVVIVIASLLAAIPRSLAASDLHAVSGVARSDQGEPLAGVMIKAWTNTPDGAGSGDDTTTAADGSYTLHLASGEGGLSIYYQPWSYSNQVPLTVKGDDITGFDLKVPTPPPRTAVIEGVVLGTDGAPIAGASVHVSASYCCVMYATDDTAPQPSTPPSTEPASSDASGSGSSGSAGSSGSTGDPTTTSADSKMVASPIRPCCYNYNPDDQDTTTDANGAFAFKVYGGQHQLTVTAKGYGQASQSVDVKDNDTSQVKIQMEKVPEKTAHVHGRVLDASTGLPIRDAQVSLSNLEWSRYLYATTGVDGSYSFDTLPGWSQINVYYYGPQIDPVMSGGIAVDMVRAPSQQYYAYVDSARITSGDNTLDVRLEPKPLPTIALVGYVVDPDAKKGVAGATVSVWDQDTGDWGSATTDQDGSYKILVRPGHFTANAWAEGHLPGALTFIVLDGAATKRVDIEAPAGTTKYAPCDDDCAYPVAMKAGYASGSGGVATMESRTLTSDASSPPTDSPQAGGTSPTPTGAAGPTPPSHEAPGANAQQAATFTGSGGGLGAYSPASASGATETGAAKAPVPMGGIAIVVLSFAAAAALIGLRRR